MSALKQLLRTPWFAVGLVTLLTLVLGFGVVVTVTPAGCGMGLRFNAHCAARTGALVTPSPQNTTPPYVYSPSPTSIPSPTAEPSPTHNPSLPPYEYDASQASPFQGGFASAPVTYQPGLACRLPIYAGQSGSGGFVAFPDRTFIADPRSGVVVPSPASSGPAQFLGLTYDQAHDKWVPVQFAWVSPDGGHYAYPSANGVSVVNVADGSLTTVGQGRSWVLIGVVNEGVYAEPGQGQGLGAGLWLLPFSGGPKQVTSAGYWQGVGGGAAYGTSTSAVPPGVANTILRLDLATGQSQPWFQVDGSQSFLDGFDGAGSPIFRVDMLGAEQLWLAPALAKAFAFVTGYFQQGVIGDAHGIWLGTGQQILLYVPGQGIFLAAGIGGYIAGPCR